MTNGPHLTYLHNDHFRTDQIQSLSSSHETLGHQTPCFSNQWVPSQTEFSEENPVKGPYKYIWFKCSESWEYSLIEIEDPEKALL